MCCWAKTETAQWTLRADWNRESVVCPRWHQTKIPTGGGKDGVKLSSLESRWHNTPLRHGLLIWNIPRKFSASLPADMKECIDLWNGMTTFLSLEHTYTAPSTFLHTQTNHEYLLIVNGTKRPEVCWWSGNPIKQHSTCKFLLPKTTHAPWPPNECQWTSETIIWRACCSEICLRNISAFLSLCSVSWCWAIIRMGKIWWGRHRARRWNSKHAQV